MTIKKQPTFTISSEYYHGVPVKVSTPRYTKDGRLCLISDEQYIDEILKPNNMFTPTAFESLMPPICMALAFLLICLIIGLS